MHRTLTAFVLALSLGLGAAPTFSDSFWTRLSTLWNSTKAGCIMDPDGRCLPAPTDQSDAGCTMDPDGRCNPGS